MSLVKGFGALGRLRRGWAVVAPVGRGVPRAPAPGVEQPSLRCRRRRVSADSWVRAAMIRSAPRRHKGHVATSRANTRPREPCPAPVWGSSLRLLLIHTLLAGRRDDRPAQLTVRRETAGVAHEMDARQGHE
jgi:hypothetical protein